MKFEFYMYLKNPAALKDWRSKPSVRVGKTLGNVAPGEVAIAMNVDVPDALFARPSLSAEIVIPKDVVPSEVKAETLDNIKEVLSRSVDLRINWQVED